MIDKIEFSLYGLDLLEPMAFVTNMIVVISCLVAYSRVSYIQTGFAVYWKMFFIFFSIASFAGALSHVFWNYWWFYGKIPSWFFGVLSTSVASLAMLEAVRLSPKVKTLWQLIIFLKAILILVLAYSTWKFMFVAVDTIVTLLGFVGFYGGYLWRKGESSMRYMLVAVGILLPSAFIFILKIDIHQWLNREDVSHLIMAIAIQFFALGIIAHRK
jgi:hypothetical protein